MGWQAAFSRFGRPSVLIPLLGCLVYCWFALGSGLDRLSAYQPAALSRVPEPFAAEALRVRAKLALNRGDVPAALAQASAALARSPTDPESAAVLGLAQLSSGNREAAERAYRVAGRLGWRVPATQAYWMDRALEQGDYRTGALRLDAMLRQNPDLAADLRMLAPLENSAQGRDALVERLRTGPVWLRPYGLAAADLAPSALRQRAQVYDLLARRQVQIGCELVSPVVEALLKARLFVEARQQWRGHCPGATRGEVYDAQFAEARPDQDRSQFAWTFLGHGDVGTLLVPAVRPPARDLAITSEAQFARVVLRQLLILEAGTYRLSWRADQENGQPAQFVYAALSCSPAPQDGLDARHNKASGRWTATARIDRSCPTHWLVFGVKGKGYARLGDVGLEQVSAVRVHP